MFQENVSGGFQDGLRTGFRTGLIATTQLLLARIHLTVEVKQVAYP